MARFVYLDETGSVGAKIKNQPHLQVVAAIVDETQVRGLGESLRSVATKHLKWFPARFEFHGNEIWNGQGHWQGMSPPELLAAYEDVISLVETHNISIAHSTIDRQGLHDRHGGSADGNAYRLALQFLLEKVDALGGLKVVVADESKEQELAAKEMVAALQEWGGGEVPGRKIASVIDSLHFVESHTSPGVQMADLVAFLFHRARLRQTEAHPDVHAARSRMIQVIGANTPTYRLPWP